MRKKVSIAAGAAAIIVVGCFMLGRRIAFAGEKYHALKQQEVIAVQTFSEDFVQESETDVKILKMNQATVNEELSGVVNIVELEELSAEDVLQMIEQYYIPDKCIYLDGRLRLEGDLDSVIERRNVEAITDPIQIRYGILTDCVAARTYPTWKKLSDEVKSQSYDYFQGDMFWAGEGIIVLHQTADENWSFIKGENGTGWIETEKIAFCQKEEMLSFIEPVSFIVVTENYLYAGDEELRMGTRLPLSRIEDGYAVVRVPEANENGNLYQSELRLNLLYGIHIGYLELSSNAIVEQAYQLQDAVFGWNNTEGTIDGSSAMGAVLRCFGIVLPQSINRMIYMGASITDLYAMSTEEKKQVICAGQPGSILVMEDHAAFYLGVSNEGIPMILHSVSSYSVDGTNVIEAYCCAVTPLTIYTENGESYMDQYQYLISFSIS